MDKVFFAKKHPDVKLPTRRDEDGAYDIYADMKDVDYIYIDPHRSVMIKTGIYSAFEKKYRFVFHERGSTGINHLKVNAGLIDSGFRGEWVVILQNTNGYPICINKTGDYSSPVPIHTRHDTQFYPSDKAICQAMLDEVPVVDIVELDLEDLLSIPSERGTGMLGSSNK